MECVANTLHTTSEHGVSSITTKSISESMYWDAKGKIFNLLNKFLHETLCLQPNIILIILF